MNINYALLIGSYLIGSYLIGSLSFAIIVSKCMALNDPRKYGSGNAGATNVLRSGNKKAAILTLLGDALKGTLAVGVARIYVHYYSGLSLDVGQTLIGLCGVLVIVGHVLPIFFKLKGGKGVATALGVFIVFSPLLALATAATWAITFKVSKVSSLAALIATVTTPVFAYLIFGNNALFGATLFISIIVLLKHKDNVTRLISGKEDKVTTSKDKNEN